MGVCFHNYWNGVAQTFGNKQGRVSKFDAKGSVAVSQIMYANIRQGGDSGAAGQLLVERCARHVEHAVVRGQPIEPGAVGAELFGQPVRNRNIAVSAFFTVLGGAEKVLAVFPAIRFINF